MRFGLNTLLFCFNYSLFYKIRIHGLYFYELSRITKISLPLSQSLITTEPNESAFESIFKFSPIVTLAPMKTLADSAALFKILDLDRLM